MSLAEAVAALAVSCFLLGFVVGFFARDFWNTYCSSIEEDTDDIECEEDDEDFDE